MNSKKIIDDNHDNSRIDYGIILNVFILALIGLLALYVAVSHETNPNAGNPIKAVIVQGLWYIVSGVIIVVIMQLDAEQLWRIAPIVYGLGIVLLILVLFLYSRNLKLSTGSRSWFAIGSLTFQPSEVMKPAYILMLSRVVATHNSKYDEHTVHNDMILLGKLILWTLPVVVLIMLQPDLGTTLVFLAIFCGIVLISGITWKILVPVFLFLVIIGSTAIMFVTTTWGQTFLKAIGFKAYQFARINTWLDPSNSQNLQGSGYQLWQSMKAIGSGQLWGRGFDHSQVYVPVRESDMIFSVIGENFGFVGSCILILLYFLLIYQMIRVTFETKNEFYAYISTGVIMMILFHVFENIGMNIGLLPLTGVPLPFLSQGGSSLMADMIGVGLIMSMRYHYKSYMFSSVGDSFN